MPSGSNVYRVTWHYAGSPGISWSEVYYATAANPAELTLFPTNAVNARLWFLHSNFAINGISVADVNNPRSTATRKVLWSGTSPFSTSYADSAESAMVCQLVGASGGSRKLWMRGLPATLPGNQAGNGLPYFGPQTLNQFQAFIGGLVSGGFGYGIRSITQTPKFQVATLAPGASPATTVVTYALVPGGPAPNFQAGQQVIMRGADRKTLPSLLGTFTILNVGTNSITIRYQLPTSTTPGGSYGYVRAATYGNVSVFAPAQCAPAYWGAHDTKNVFTRSRGARSARRIRTQA